MTIEAVVQFLEATSEKESLQRDLAEIIGVGDGDVSSAVELDKDEAKALRGGRGVLVTTFADQQGYAFTVAELSAVVGVFQRFQSGELSESEFASALGLKESATEQLASVGKSVGWVYRGVKYDSKEDSASTHHVFEFMKKTAEDDQFREQLQEILNVGDGNISSFAELDADELQALKSGRGALVAEFAANHGFLFTMADLFAVIDAFQRVQSGELTESEFAKFLRVNAGKGEFFPFIGNVIEMTYKGFHYSKAIPSAAQDNTLQVVRFMERSESDSVLRNQLQLIIGGDGDISDPSELDSEEAGALTSDRNGRIVDLGAEHGFRFSPSDLSAVVGAFQLVNTGKLSQENCIRILGLKKTDAVVEGILAHGNKTAGLMYRGVRY